MCVSKRLIYIEPCQNTGMATCHMYIRFYDDYCVGAGIEYPGIMVRADNEKDLTAQFQKLIPAFKKNLKRNKHDCVNKVVTVEEPMT